MAKKLYYEIFNEFENAKEKDKVKILAKYALIDRVLQAMLVAVFHPGVQFAPIASRIHYKPSDTPPGMGYSSIKAEMERMYIYQHPKSPIRDVWRPGNPKIANISDGRRAEILIQALEALEPKEAQLFLNVLNKDFKVKGLTEAVVRQAIPNLLGPDTK